MEKHIKEIGKQLNQETWYYCHNIQGLTSITQRALGRIEGLRIALITLDVPLSQIQLMQFEGIEETASIFPELY